MYELKKKIGKVLTSKTVGPSSYEKRLYRAAVSQRLRNTALDEGSTRRRDLYLTTHNAQQQTDIRAPGGIRTRNPGKRTAVDPRLRPRFHRVLPFTVSEIHGSSYKYTVIEKDGRDLKPL